MSSAALHEIVTRAIEFKTLPRNVSSTRKNYQIQAFAEENLKQYATVRKSVHTSIKFTFDYIL